MTDAPQARRGRLRHALSAMLGVGGGVLGLLGVVAAVGSPASAAADDLVGTTVFDCKVSTFPNYEYDGTITLSATRPADSSTVTISASMSKMSGKVPVSLSNVAFENTLGLSVDGSPVSLTGSGKVDIVANKPFAMPDLQGSFTSTAESATVEVSAFSFNLPTFAMAGSCTPTSGAELGTLTVVEGTTPTPTPTATTTTSATATPTTTTSPTSTGSTDASGSPASGKAAYACALNIGSKFKWNPTVSVSGYREDDGDPVSLVATMSNLPGLSPVLIDGAMNYTLDLTVGGKKVTLKSTGDVYAQPNQQVPVADLSGTVDVAGDELEVVTTGFTFDFPSGGVGATCTGKSSLGTLTVGSEPPADNGDDGVSDPSGATTTSTTTSTTGALPKTGGGDATPVVLLWAGAFVLLGAAALLAVPGRLQPTRSSRTDRP